MNCQEMTEALHGYFDHELDPVRSLEAERHLKQCPACLQRYQQQQALRQVLAERSAYYEAPPALDQRVRAALRAASPAKAAPVRPSWDLSRLWLRWLAPAAVVALALLVALPWLLQPSGESRLAQNIVSAHARSLMAEHLTDVASTDQHTVKPWFNGKLTFSPPVTDLAAQGFPLVGARLDVLEEQPVAALVYQRHKHFINLFIWPTTRSGSTREKFLAQRGYNLAHWTQGGMDCWAVSDVGRGDLQQFANLVRGQTPAPDAK
jgi:mycothiol system anti-sigma-R factor